MGISKVERDTDSVKLENRYVIRALTNLCEVKIVR